MDSNERKVRYAVVGAGNIAQVAVLPAFAHAGENSELVAIVSGDGEKREALAKRYRLDLSGDYDDLEVLIERGKIDALYIATPNTEHKDLTLRAAQLGVHVLCEKPLAPTVLECEEMVNACRAAKVKLMVAYRLHFEATSLRALQLVQSGKLGRATLFSSFFTHVVRQGDIRRMPDLAGGATNDLGVYCINAARTLFGAEPISAFASSIDKEGVDDSLSATLTFPGDRLAQFTVSNSVAGTSSYRIGGSGGNLRVEPAFDYDGPSDLYLTVDGHTTHEPFGSRDQFAPELVYFSNCVLDGVEPEPSGEEAICDVRVIEALLKSAKSQRPVELKPRQRERRPTPAQEMYKPPVDKPEPVKAPSPSEG